MSTPNWGTLAEAARIMLLDEGALSLTTGVSRPIVEEATDLQILIGPLQDDFISAVPHYAGIGRVWAELG